MAGRRGGCQAEAGLLGRRNHRFEEPAQVLSERRVIDVAIAVEHAAQALDVVAVERARKAGHDGGEQALLLRRVRGLEPGAGAGENLEG